MVLAAFLAWWIYLRRRGDSVIPRAFVPVLLAARILTLAVIALLIISPWIRKKVKITEKPVFVIAQDNSQSIIPEKDSAAFVEARIKLIDQLETSLDQDYNVQNVLFGSTFRKGKIPDYQDKATDFGELFKSLMLSYGNKAVEGVLLLSDGCYTQGTDIPRASAQFPFTVNVMASGDPSDYPDLSIQEVIANDWVRRNSRFQVRVYFKADQWAGNPFEISVNGKNGLLAKRTFETGASLPLFTDLEIDAPDKGIMRLNINIKSDVPERNPDNNYRNLQIRIIEQEGNILCLYDAPHPDIGAITRAISGFDILRADAFPADGFNGKLSDYSLVVLHGLPSVRNKMAGFLDEVRAKSLPILFIITSSTSQEAFNRFGTGFQIREKRTSPQEAQGYLNTLFTLFTLPDDFNEHLSTWPPLNVDIGTYGETEGSQTLINQRIRRIDFTDPLVLFTGSNGVKYGVICGDGIWQWRIYEYLEKGDHYYFDDLVSRMVQYLMTDEKQDRFRIAFPEDPVAFRPIRVNAYLHNNSMEAVNTPDVNLVLKDSLGLETKYVLGRLGDYYQLDLNGFKPGIYQYSAFTKFGDEEFTSSGEFMIRNFMNEKKNPTADFNALSKLATSKNGRFFTPDQEDQLISFIDNLKKSPSTVRSELRWIDLINVKWLLGILVLLLSLEWFLRRWFGTR